MPGAGWFASSPARELRMGSSRSIVAPVVRLTSPSSVPVVQTSSCCPIAESLDAVIDHRRSMLRFLSPACRRSPDQASRNRTSRAFVCRVVCLMWNACPKPARRCSFVPARSLQRGAVDSRLLRRVISSSASVPKYRSLLLPIQSSHINEHPTNTE